MLKTFLPYFEENLGQLVWRLSTLVESETPTHQKAHVDAVTHQLAQWGEEQNAQVTMHPHSVVGDFVECRWNPDAPGKAILISCHVDTVHPLGSVERRPTRVEDDVLFGVGSLDMKAGITIVQSVIEMLQTTQQMPNRPVIALFTTDEEIGSPYSRPLIERVAKDAGLALVMEFCNYEEQIVTSRKGVGIFQLTALGREAHSGSNPEDGINAVVEIAHLLDDVAALSDVEKGTLVTPTVIRGGTGHNVIPGECDLVVNVRVKYHSEAQRVEAGLMALEDAARFLEGAEVFLTGEFMRPPMEHDSVMEKTFETLLKVTGEVFGETFRGGGSDASFPAALGIPTLDGLGPSGEGAHAAHEQVFLPSMPRRAALLASLICGWPKMPRDD